MNEHSLKPCPFCGKIPVFIERVTDRANRPYFDIACGTGGCYLEDGADWWLKSAQEAKDLWEKRSKTEESRA